MEVGVDVTTLVILLPLFRVFLDELLLVKAVCPRRNGERPTRVNQADKGDLADERILLRHQDEPKVAVLSPSAGTLDLRGVCSE